MKKKFFLFQLIVIYLSLIFNSIALEKDYFKRGAPEKFGYNSTSVFEMSIYDLLSAYGEHTHRSNVKTLHIQSSALFSPEDAIQRMVNLID